MYDCETYCVYIDQQSLNEGSCKDGCNLLKIRNIDNVKRKLGSLGSGVKVLIGILYQLA